MRGVSVFLWDSFSSANLIYNVHLGPGLRKCAADSLHSGSGLGPDAQSQRPCVRAAVSTLFSSCRTQEGTNLLFLHELGTGRIKCAIYPLYKLGARRALTRDLLLRHTYLISLEIRWNTFASNLKWALWFASAVIMALPAMCSWAMEDRLVPWVHYVPTILAT
jgi:hypothetical protein